MFKTLQKNTYMYYAILHYNKGNKGSWISFREDFKLFSRISKYILSRRNGKDSRQYISANHIINNIICLSNVYDSVPLARLLFFICDEETHPTIKSCLHFLYKCPLEIPEANLNKVPFDIELLDELKAL